MRRLSLLLVALALLAPAACRDDLCVQTRKAVCPCHDPLYPDVDSCLATVDVVGCGPVDAAVDPCTINPCCANRPADAAVRPPTDMAMSLPPDLAAPPADMSAATDLASDGAAQDLATGN